MILSASVLYLDVTPGLGNLHWKLRFEELALRPLALRQLALRQLALRLLTLRQLALKQLLSLWDTSHSLWGNSRWGNLLWGNSLWGNLFWGTHFQELALRNSLRGTLFKELTSRNSLRGTCFKEFASRNSLRGTRFEELASRNSLQGTHFMELTLTNSLRELLRYPLKGCWVIRLESYCLQTLTRNSWRCTKSVRAQQLTIITCTTFFGQDTFASKPFPRFVKCRGIAFHLLTNHVVNIDLRSTSFQAPWPIALKWSLWLRQMPCIVQPES
jgi:hypothetical protein